MSAQAPVWRPSCKGGCHACEAPATRAWQGQDGLRRGVLLHPQPSVHKFRCFCCIACCHGLGRRRRVTAVCSGAPTRLRRGGGVGRLAHAPQLNEALSALVWKRLEWWNMFSTRAAGHAHARRANEAGGGGGGAVHGSLARAGSGSIIRSRMLRLYAAQLGSLRGALVKAASAGEAAAIWGPSASFHSSNIA